MSDVRDRLSPLFSWRSAVVESDLTSTERLVALVMSLHMTERGDSAFPFISTLAEETGLARRTVQKALAGLQEKGWLVLDEPGGMAAGGKRRSNTYQATIPEQAGRTTIAPGVQETTGAGRSEDAPGVYQERPLEESALRERHGKENLPAAPTRDLVVYPPKLTKIDGRDLAFDALAKECAIMPASPRAREVAVALNGRKGKPEEGIRYQFWAEQTIDWRMANLPSLWHSGQREDWERGLVAAIALRCTDYRRKMPPGSLLTPLALAKWWTDLPRMPVGDGRLSAADALAAAERLG